MNNQAENQKLASLVDLAEILTEQNNYEETVRLVAYKATSLFHAEAAHILLLNPKTNQTVKTVFRNSDENRNAQFRKLQILVCGWVLENKQAFLTEDVKKDKRFRKKLFKQMPVKSVMATLMRVEGVVIGCLLLINKSGNKIFTKSDLELLQKMCAVVSPHLRNVQKLREYFEAPETDSALSMKYNEFGMLGKSKKFIELIQSVEAAARCDARVVLEGETGVGKEKVARALHKFSLRKNNPFVAIDCGAIPENLVESELFGHVKGAFTGAQQGRIGIIEKANKGVLFMDEIANLSYDLQVKLLRALQEGVVRPIGSNETREVDVRIVVAASTPLIELVKQGKFREDLYFRLYVYPIQVPSLNERSGDIPLLANHFLNKFTSKQAKKAQAFHGSIIDFMQRRMWQGNIRELENFVERMVTLAHADIAILDYDILPPDFQKEFKKLSSQGNSDISAKPLAEILAETEEKNIRQQLEENKWNQSSAARALGMTEGSIRHKMKKHGIVKPNG